MVVVCGTADNGIGKGIASALRIDCISAERKDFPDGEFKIRVPETNGTDAVVVQSMHRPQTEHLQELLFTADILRDRGMERITAVVPYLAYARQDRAFAAGEGVSIKTVMLQLNAVGISRLVTVQPHKADSLEWFKGTAGIVYPINRLAKEAASELDNPIVVGPDAGARGLAAGAAGELECEFILGKKTRDVEGGGTTMQIPEADRVRDHDVFIPDDIISSGGTIAQAAGILKKNGARKIVVAAAHLAMDGNGLNKMKAAGVSLVMGTNSIPTLLGRAVDISGDIAEALVAWGITSRMPVR